MRHITLCHLEDIALLCWVCLTKVANLIRSECQLVKISATELNICIGIDHSRWVRYEHIFFQVLTPAFGHSALDLVLGHQMEWIMCIK